MEITLHFFGDRRLKTSPEGKVNTWNAKRENEKTRPKPLLLGVFLSFYLSIQFFVEKCQAILRLRSGHAFKAILTENENSQHKI